MGTGRRQPLGTVTIAAAVGALALSMPACGLDSTGSPLGLGSSATGSGAAGSGGGGTGGAGAEDAGLAILAWSAAEPAADGTLALPPEMKLTSPSADKTSQVGPNELRAGFGPDAARARNPTGRSSDWGLTVESERTNEIWPSEPAGTELGSWVYVIAGTNSFPAFAEGPAGASGVEASRIVTDAMVNGPYAIYNQVASGSRTWSLWTRRNGGATTYSHLARRSPANTWEPWPFDPYLDVWSRRDRTFSITNETIHTVFDARPFINAAQNGAAVDLLVAYVQYEGGAYPSSAIPTTTAARTRAAESLRASALETLLPGGWLDVELRWVPHYASGEQAADHDLLHVDTNNRVFVRVDGSIVLLIQGEELATEALAWARDTEIRIVCRSTADGRVLQVSGTTPAADLSGAAKEPIAPLPAEMHVLGGPLGGGKFGAQESADLRYIAFR